MTGDTGWAMDGDLLAAIARSSLRAVPPDILGQLLAGSTCDDRPAGWTLRREAQPGRHLELVVTGLARIFLTAPDGRTLTIRYCRTGSLMGAVSLAVSDYAMPGSIQVLVASRLLIFRPDHVADLARQDLSVAAALQAELSDRLLAFVAEIRDSAFASVRQRVARHLLDLASERLRGDRLVARTTQQALADAVGSVREVVVRVLHDLRVEGIVATERNRIVILAPDRLLGESSLARPDHVRRSSGT